MSDQWHNKHCKGFDTPEEVLQARIEAYRLETTHLLEFYVYVAFCRPCKTELEHVVTIGITGVGPHDDDIFQCRQCKKTYRPDDDEVLLVRGTRT